MIAVVYGVEGQILARMSYSTKFAKNALTHGLSVKNQLCPVRTAAATWPRGDQDLNWSDASGIFGSRSDRSSALADATTRTSCLATCRYFTSFSSKIAWAE